MRNTKNSDTCRCYSILPPDLYRLRAAKTLRTQKIDLSKFQNIPIEWSPFEFSEKK
jgi:hypothetical protein